MVLMVVKTNGKQVLMILEQSRDLSLKQQLRQQMLLLPLLAVDLIATIWDQRIDAVVRLLPVS